MKQTNKHTHAHTHTHVHNNNNNRAASKWRLCQTDTAAQQLSHSRSHRLFNISTDLGTKLFFVHIHKCKKCIKYHPMFTLWNNWVRILAHVEIRGLNTLVVNCLTHSFIIFIDQWCMWHLTCVAAVSLIYSQTDKLKAFEGTVLVSR